MNNKEKIIAFFKDNEEIFIDCIEELDGWNGYLGDDRYYFMEELDELYADETPTNILYRAFYGHDSETWTTDAHGKKEYGPFNPNREYFTYNGYGNLVSADYKDYSGHLDVYFVEALAENRKEIASIDDNEELFELFNMLEAEEEGDAE